VIKVERYRAYYGHDTLRNLLYLILCQAAIYNVLVDMDLVSFRAEKYVVCNILMGQYNLRIFDVKLYSYLQKYQFILHLEQKNHCTKYISKTPRCCTNKRNQSTISLVPATPLSIISNTDTRFNNT
jgi:hypothetical protein